MTVLVCFLQFMFYWVCVLPTRDAGIVDVATASVRFDTVPKLEIDGRLKVNDIPEGLGMQVVTDASGNFFKSGVFLPTQDSQDSLTYTIITGFGPVFPTGTYPLESFAASGTNMDFTGAGVPFNLTKTRDIVSPGFAYLLALQPSNTIEIEVKVYVPGAPTPFVSYKLKNITVLAFSHSASGGTGVSESYTILPEIFGIMNVETGGSFAYNSMTNSQVPY